MLTVACATFRVPASSLLSALCLASVVAVAYAQPQLNDAQLIQAAIQRGVEEKRPGGLIFPDSTSNIVNHAPKVESFTFGKVRQRAIFLSDSDRIALAAFSASHDAAWRLRKDFSFSVEDAKISAGKLGVTTLLLEVISLGSKNHQHLVEWFGTGAEPKVMLSIDGKLIEPSDRQYSGEKFGLVVSEPSSPLVFGLSRPPASTAPAGRLWDWQQYFSFNVQTPSKYGVLECVFPQIPPEHKVTLITIGARGQRMEKQVPSRAFEGTQP